jgi:hypothetical protein
MKWVSIVLSFWEAWPKSCPLLLLSPCLSHWSSPWCMLSKIRMVNVLLRWHILLFFFFLGKIVQLCSECVESQVIWLLLCSFLVLLPSPGRVPDAVLAGPSCFSCSHSGVRPFYIARLTSIPKAILQRKSSGKG